MEGSPNYWLDKWSEIPLMEVNGLEERIYKKPIDNNKSIKIPSYLKYTRDPRNQNLLIDLCRKKTKPLSLVHFLIQKNNAICRSDYSRNATLPTNIPFRLSARERNAKLIISQFDDYQNWLDDWVDDIVLHQLRKNRNFCAKGKKQYSPLDHKELYEWFENTSGPIPVLVRKNVHEKSSKSKPKKNKFIIAQTEWRNNPYNKPKSKRHK